MPESTKIEEWLPLSWIAKLLPGEPSYKTVWQLYSYGRRRVSDKKYVFLETKRTHQGLCTSVEAYDRFVEELNDG